jgi:hypothetical protein
MMRRRQESDLLLTAHRSDVTVKGSGQNFTGTYRPGNTEVQRPAVTTEVRRSRQKPRFLLAPHEVMSAEIAGAISAK